MDKIILEQAKLNCPQEKAFEMFTSGRHLEKWLTEKAEVEPRAGGKFELFWEPDNPEVNSTIGCKVLAIESPCFLTFEWKGPTQYKNIMNGIRPLTNVTVIFIQEKAMTTVSLIHTGWRETEEWEEARLYFLGAWKGAFRQLENFVNGE